jgi:hypothetical protein
MMFGIGAFKGKGMPNLKDLAEKAASQAKAYWDRFGKFYGFLWSRPGVRWGLGAWVLLSFFMFLIMERWGQWIELLNGATWPTALGEQAVREWWTRIPFSLVLSARTLLNLAGLGAVVFAAYWFWFGGKEKAMARTLVNVRAAQNQMLEFVLLNFLQDNLDRTIDASFIDAFKNRIQKFTESAPYEKLESDLLKAAAHAAVSKSEYR